MHSSTKQLLRKSWFLLTTLLLVVGNIWLIYSGNIILGGFGVILFGLGILIAYNQLTDSYQTYKSWRPVKDILEEEDTLCVDLNASGFVKVMPLYDEEGDQQYFGTGENYPINDICLPREATLLAFRNSNVTCFTKVYSRDGEYASLFEGVLGFDGFIAGCTTDHIMWLRWVGDSAKYKNQSVPLLKDRVLNALKALPDTEPLVLADLETGKFEYINQTATKKITPPD